jgi:lipopolysaccharide/colanic/teichoic acid biosynthesis glycosyltransferase
MYKIFLKPLFARVGAFICILLLWPLMLLIAIMIRIDSAGNALFLQERMGKNGKNFYIIKFRSMKKNAFYEGTGAYTYENDPRITRVGRIIRNTSLDELPQLFNILYGKMCFIGPRPLLPDIPLCYEKYPEEYKPRFSVLPGLFCLVDAKQRAEASFETQCMMDVEYVNNISFIGDVKIFLGTFRMVLLRKGVYRVQCINNETKEKSEVL